MVYRTHDDPDPEKLERFSMFAQKFGYNLDISPEKLPSELNRLSTEIVGKAEQGILEGLAIRSMAKAKYTTHTDGHYGLGFEHYSHFTSPIRRYPDVMVHRLLQNYLDEKPSPEQDKFEKKCMHSSKQEKLAADAERASIKYKQVEYMQQFLGQEMDGIIVSITDWGMYVEMLDTKCEGMVRIADIEEDSFYFNPDFIRVEGINNGKQFNLGDILKVRVLDTNLETRNIDLEYISTVQEVGKA